jgi:hypothetical protein
MVCPHPHALGATPHLALADRREWGTRSIERRTPSRAGAPDGVSSFFMGLGRLELPTSRLSGVRSNHLSYRPLGKPKGTEVGAGVQLRAELSSLLPPRVPKGTSFASPTRSPTPCGGPSCDIKVTASPGSLSFPSRRRIPPSAVGARGLPLAGSTQQGVGSWMTGKGRQSSTRIRRS